MLSRLYPFIKITVLDNIRNKIVIGVLIFSLISSLTSFVIINLAAQDVGKVAIDFQLSSFSLVGLFLIFFACGSSLYRDIDRRTISFALSRAISRQEYIVGKFFGYGFLIFFVLGIAFIVGITNLYVIKLLFSRYFTAPWSGILAAYFLSFFAFILLLSVLIFFSVLTTSAYTALTLTIMVYFIGNSIGDLRDFAESDAAIQAGFPDIFRVVLRIIHLIVPDLSKFNLKVFAANGLPIEGSYIFFSLLYAVIYCSILLMLSVKAFKKREFI